MRVLLLVHGAVALALLAATVAQSASCLPWMWSATGRPRVAHLSAFLVPALAILELALGLALYPTYRTDVRFGALEVPRAAGGLGMAWLARLFDLKEHLVALSVPAAVGGGILARLLGPEGLPRRRALVVGLSCFTTLAVLTGAIVGLWVTSVRTLS